jgi:Protein of unknown function (DUF3703)
MSSFSKLIQPYIETELLVAVSTEFAGKHQHAFLHLERAHVLGQSSTFQHVRVHWRMFCWGWRQRDARECLGQLMRIVGAATKTAIGFVPSGNTGGSNISLFKVLPIPPELNRIIEMIRKVAK